MKRITSLLIAVAVTLAIVGYQIPVSAKTGDTEVTVKSKSAFSREMQRTEACTVILKLKGNKKLTIGKTGYSENKKLIINSANSEITNKTVWKSVTIKKVASFTEKASGNTITVKDKNAKINIYKKVKVASLTAPDYRNITLGKKAKILKPETPTEDGNTVFVGKKTNIQKQVTTTSLYTVYEAPSNIVQFKGPDGSFYFAVDGDKEVTIYKTKNGEILDKTVGLKKEHSIFGTVTCDEDGYFYLVTGENNEGNDYLVKTVFVSKYDSNGKHIKTAGHTGHGEREDDFNTQYPFGCGCSAAVMDGVITVNYSRGMYNGHQSNNVFAMYTSDLTAFEFETFYNSHSFGQRAITIPEQSTFVFASHGDGFPRCDRIAIMKMYKGKMLSYNDYQLFHFWCPKEDGENNTYACLGGIAKLSYDRLVLVGESAPSISKEAPNEYREIFIQIFNPLKDLYSEDAYYTKGTRSGVTGIGDDNRYWTNYGVKWLSSYGEGYYISNVQLAVTEDDRIVVLYELYKSDRTIEEWPDRYSSEYQGVYYIVLDANGEVISDAKLYDKNALLNPFQMPVFADGKIYWVDNRYELEDRYNEKKKDVYLYELDLGPTPDNLFSIKESHNAKKVVAIDRNSFPDDNFREYVEVFADVNKDMYLDESEIASFSKIDFGSFKKVFDDEKYNIETLKGIEYFTSLEYLDCSNNLLKELDVSKNTALTYLKCSENKLTRLNIGNLTGLKTLILDRNEINTLDLQNDTELEYLDCSRNKLTALNIRNNKALVYLDCCENRIVSLDVSNNEVLEHLRCSEDLISYVDVSKNTELKRFFCSGENLYKVDVSKNRKLVELNCACSFGLNELDVSNNPELEVLICYCTSIKKLDVSNNKKLYNLNFGITQVSKIDLSNNLGLVYLACPCTPIVSLDLSQFPLLEVLELSEDKLISLDISRNPLLRELYVNKTGLTRLDISNNPELEVLKCADNPLQSLDIRNNPKLKNGFFEHDATLNIIS